MEKEKSEPIIISINDFYSNRKKVIEMDEHETNTTLEEITQYQPNMMHYLMELYSKPDTNDDLPIEIFIFLLTLWHTIKDYPNVKTQKIPIGEFELCYNNNLAYFNLLDNATNKAEYEEIVINAIDGYRQIEIYVHLFSFDQTFYDNLKEHEISKWFCILKTNIDVIDKLINNQINTINP